MDTNEAQVVLGESMRRFRAKQYDELVRLVDQRPTITRPRGTSGATYQVAIQVFWDGGTRAAGNVRVLGAVDDGGPRALMPLTDSFIMTPDGSFVGE